MTKSKHTPGPWDWRGQMLWEKLADDVRGDVVGEAHIANDYDRCLIAAAPDLLEALEDMLAQADFAAEVRGGEGHMKYAMRKARAAIAKAKGKE